MVRFAILSLVLLVAAQTARSGESHRLSDYIRPLVGTKGEGNTYPGPSAPFGMVQLSPDTDKELWDTASGYEYSDPTIFGFSLTHLSGTGIPDLGDFLFVPQVGEPKLVSGTKGLAGSGYLARYSHNDEAASAGYYRVKLQDSGVNVELTAGERAGMMRMTFPASEKATILLDLQHVLSGKKWKVVWSHLRVENNSTVTGYHLVNGWAKERPLYFAARFSRPFDKAEIFSDGKPVIYDTYRFRSAYEAVGTDLKFLATYVTNKQEPILIKVAVSAVSAANALKNLDDEIKDWDFDALRERTRRRWDDELARIKIEGTEQQKETFYTSMYHTLLAPNLYEDVNGEYRGLDQNTRVAKGFTNYTVFSLWDTYRATHPLFALIEAPRDADMINSMLAHYDQSVEHMLPIWSLQANETWCMIGYHAVPVIADAIAKNVKGFDVERAYEAAKTTAMNPHYDSVATYAKLGWVPFDKENESVSKTLEYAYDDYTIAQTARRLGKRDDANYFQKRAESYKNLFDPSVGLMRGKDSAGHWHSPFNPHSYDETAGVNDFTEGTSWQYSWYVPQDVPGLISLMGGRDAFAKKLDSLFTFREADASKGVSDIQGRIGEYWHGNEPSHHVIYLYSYAGQPWKTAERLREVVTKFYGNDPDSLSGNDDCGQMSAWYVFTCLGFYPVCPASDYYVIGAPQLPKAVMHLSNGHDFTMTAEKLSEANKYVQSATLDGKRLDQPFLKFTDLAKGGTLVFTMGPQPSAWGTHPQIPAAD
ncbi:MAG: GH92 family glycosyl hydrolase [Chthoniobacterales bacterium]